MAQAPVLLFAEDDADIAFLVCREFRRSLPGWEICHVADGREAAQHLEQGLNPRLLVTDLNMPRMDGFALIDWVRRDKALDVPIIVLSSLMDPQTRSRCLELGADQFVAKEMGTLHETIGAVIECLPKTADEAGPHESGARPGVDSAVSGKTECNSSRWE